MLKVALCKCYLTCLAMFCLVLCPCEVIGLNPITGKREGAPCYGRGENLPLITSVVVVQRHKN